MPALTNLEPHEHPGDDGHNQSTNLTECRPFGCRPRTGIHAWTVTATADSTTNLRLRAELAEKLLGLVGRRHWLSAGNRSEKCVQAWQAWLMVQYPHVTLPSDKSARIDVLLPWDPSKSG